MKMITARTAMTSVIIALVVLIVFQLKIRHKGLAAHAEEVMDSIYGPGSFVTGFKSIKYATSEYAAFDVSTTTSGETTNLIISVDRRISPIRVVLWPTNSWHIE